MPPALRLKELCILPTQCIYVFLMVLTIHSDYLPEQCIYVFLMVLTIHSDYLPKQH
jgi:hypothetical protein